MSRPPIPLLGVRTSSLKKLECAKAGVAYSPQCRQRTAILLLLLWQVVRSVWKFQPNCLQKPAQFNVPAEFTTSHWATSPIALSGREYWAVANVGDSLRRLSSLHRIYINTVGGKRGGRGEEDARMWTPVADKKGQFWISRKRLHRICIEDLRYLSTAVAVTCV